MTDDEIRKGDDVVHRESGKRGKVLEVLHGVVAWQVIAPQPAPLEWAVVWWEGDPKPVVEAIADIARA